ncbi:unnamed protein product [Mycena citricolor]|uniref:Cytochrome P450 n=1 Tax=Mycena citricolor TaxID=2018698 RepID=A0AAD2HI18_9AGAR|nr:unnamed protein product [Mycena citricolor]
MHGDALIVTLVSLWFVYTCTLIIIVWAVFYTCRALRCHWCSTALQGPPATGESVASCAARYGPVFSVPVRLWTRKVVLCDPRAITHFYANAAGIYRLDPGTRKITENLVGRGLTWVDGADHSGHKQALAPFFSASAVAGYFPAFCDTVAKVREPAARSHPWISRRYCCRSTTNGGARWSRSL